MTDPVVPVQPVAVVPGSTPGRTLGIVGLVVDFFVPIVGLILSIVGKVQSRRVGAKNTPATVGIVLGIIFTVFYVVLFSVLGVAAGTLASKCADLGPGTHTVSGVTYTCS
jgi:hypothetical protein